MSESKLYEKVLEISKSKVSELTWNNILFEANLDLKSEMETDPEQVSLLQDNIQELQTQNQQLQEELTNSTKELTSIIGKVGSEEELNRLIINSEKIPVLQEQLNKIGLERTNLQNSLTNTEKSLHQVNSQVEQLKITSENTQLLQTDINKLKAENASLSSQLSDERVKNTKYDDLYTEFTKREEKFNALQSKLKEYSSKIDLVSREKGDIESALVTQKKIYEELVEKSKHSAESSTKELIKLRTELSDLKKPKKRGRPPKKVETPSSENIDGGSLESVTL